VHNNERAILKQVSAVAEPSNLLKNVSETRSRSIVIEGLAKMLKLCPSGSNRLLIKNKAAFTHD
jgi:hypothetical protein